MLSTEMEGRERVRVRLEGGRKEAVRGKARCFQAEKVRQEEGEALLFLLFSFLSGKGRR